MDYQRSRSAQDLERDQPAQGAGEVIYLNAERRNDPARDDPQFRDIHNMLMEKLAGLLKQEKEEVLEEIKQFSEAKRTHLRDSEVVVLYVAYLLGLENTDVGYADVLSFAIDNGKPLSDGAVWKAFAELAGLGLLRRVPGPHATRAGRPREMFALTQFGAIALSIAVAYEKHLRECCAQVAA